MGKPLSYISKTEFRDSYNIFEVLTSKKEIMEFVKTLKDDNNHAVAFAIKKQHKLTLEDIMIEIQKINNRLDNIEDRLDRNHIN